MLASFAMQHEPAEGAIPSSPPPHSSTPPAPPAAPLPPLPPVAPEEALAFAGLLGLVRRLRAPGGCPWDREQTLRTLTPYILEEAYEVIDAIERDDSRGLREELGDLVFLLFFCAEIGREAGRFAIDELLLDHVRKMIGRHPHVFADRSAIGAAGAARQWEELKQDEQPGAAGDRRSVVAGRLPALPALTAAFRVQEKAAAVGFDWPAPDGALAKLAEEIQELRQALAANDAERAAASPGADASDSASRAREELGDVLFAVVNVARRWRIDPEAALRSATAKFMRRFQYIEARLEAQGLRPADTDLAAMDRLWEEAKSREATGVPATTEVTEVTGVTEVTRDTPPRAPGSPRGEPREP
jgi:MazG family protein